MQPLATVRDRWSSFVGAFVALALGVALLTSTLGVYASARPAVPERFAGTAVFVQSPAAGDGDDQLADHVPWSPERADALVGELAAIPAVTAAVPDRSFYAQVVRDGRPLGDPPAGHLLGHAWSTTALAPYALTSGAAPAGESEVVLGEGYGIPPGQRVTVLTATGPAGYTVTGTVDGPGIYLSDRAAGRLAAGVTAIGLVTEPGADADVVAEAARAVVGTGGEVRTGDARTALEPTSHARIRWVGAQLLSVMAMLAGFAAVFVVAATFSLAAHQRRRELALLRAVGAVPRQVRRLMLGEALLVGAAAAIVGVPVGSVLVPILGNLLVKAELEPPGFSAGVTPLPVAIAASTGLVVALLAVSAASRRAARTRPVEALRDAAVDQRPMTRSRWVLGGLCVACGLGLAVTTAGADGDPAITTAGFSAMALIAGLALLAPVIVPPVARAATLPLGRLAGATGMLVRENAVAAVRRTAATAAPVLVTVGFAVLVFGMVETLSPAFGSEVPHRTGAGVVVSPDGVPGLSDVAVAAVPGQALSAVDSTVYTVRAGAGTVALAAAGVDATILPRLARVEAGSVAALRGRDTVVVAAAVAAQSGWQVGEAVPITFADGRTVPVRVVAVVEDGSVPWPVVLTAATLRAHDPSALTGAVYVRGADPATVDRAVAGLGATAADAATYAARDEEDRLVRIFALVMVGMSVGYTGIAVANTLMMATGARRRDFAVLRTAGATASQVLRVVAAETLLVVGLGTVLGATVALPALLGIRSALAESVGRPVALLLPWPEVLTVVGACTVLALAASLASAALALRARARG